MLPPFHQYFPNIEVNCRRLAAIPPCHLAIPSAYLIPTVVRLFCPRFHHHRATPLPATVDHASDLPPSHR
jgi:hypothetical protein